MSKQQKPPKNKHVKTARSEDVKVYTPKRELASEQSAELPQERSARKGFRPIHEREYSKKRVWLLLGAAALFLVMWFLPTEGWMRTALFLVPYILLATDVCFDAVEEILAGKYLCKDVLVLIPSAGLLCMGKNADGFAVMLLYRACEQLEAYIAERLSSTASEIHAARPESANLETNDGLLNVFSSDVRVGEIIMVDRDEPIPLDGEIIEGSTSVSTAPLTGSNKPVSLSTGMRAISGCINLSKPIRVRVTADYDGSTAAKALNLLECAKANIAEKEQRAAALERVYSPVLCGVALLTAVLPAIFWGGWMQWLYRALLLVYAANLSGINVSIPAAFAGGEYSGFKNGILFKGTRYIEELARSKTVVFNKTATITEGRYTISDVVPVKISEHELLTLAATAEKYSDHPIARALKEACGMFEPPDAEVTQAQEIPSKGVSAFVNGKLVYVGNALLLDEHYVKYTVPSRAGTAIHVSMDGKYCGYIIMNDKVKDGAFDALEALRVQGVGNMVMLTGDLRTPAKLTASSLNFDMVKAELTPDKKLSAVEYLMATQSDSSMLAYVGDAVADAALLKRADVGIALGALADNSALDTADVAVMANELRKLPTAYSLAKNSYNAARTNMIVGLAVKALILALGFFGLMPIWAAAFFDSSANAFMMLNALKTLKNWK